MDNPTKDSMGMVVDPTLDDQIALMDFVLKETHDQFVNAGVDLSRVQEMGVAKEIIMKNYPNCLRKKIIEEFSPQRYDVMHEAFKRGEPLPLPGEAK